MNSLKLNNKIAADYLWRSHRSIMVLLKQHRNYTNVLEERLFLMCVYLAYKLGVYDDSKGKSRFINVTLLSCPPVRRGSFKPRAKSRILSCCGVIAPCDVIYNHYEIGHGLVDRTRCFVCKKRETGANHHACSDSNPQRVDKVFVGKMRIFIDALFEQGLSLAKVVTTKSRTRHLSTYIPPKWDLWWELKNKMTAEGIHLDHETSEDWSTCLVDVPMEYRLVSPSMASALGTPWHESSIGVFSPNCSIETANLAGDADKTATVTNDNCLKVTTAVTTEARTTTNTTQMETTIAMETSLDDLPDMSCFNLPNYKNYEPVEEDAHIYVGDGVTAAATFEAISSPSSPLVPTSPRTLIEAATIERALLMEETKSPEMLVEMATVLERQVMEQSLHGTEMSKTSLVEPIKAGQAPITSPNTATTVVDSPDHSYTVEAAKLGAMIGHSPQKLEMSLATSRTWAEAAHAQAAVFTTATAAAATTTTTLTNTLRTEAVTPVPSATFEGNTNETRVLSTLAEYVYRTMDLSTVRNELVNMVRQAKNTNTCLSGDVYVMLNAIVQYELVNSCLDKCTDSPPQLLQIRYENARTVMARLWPWFV